MERIWVHMSSFPSSIGVHIILLSLGKTVHLWVINCDTKNLSRSSIKNGKRSLIVAFSFPIREVYFDGSSLNIVGWRKNFLSRWKVDRKRCFQNNNKTVISLIQFLTLLMPNKCKSCSHQESWFKIVLFCHSSNSSNFSGEKFFTILGSLNLSDG